MIVEQLNINRNC